MDDLIIMLNCGANEKQKGKPTKQAFFSYHKSRFERVFRFCTPTMNSPNNLATFRQGCIVLVSITPTIKVPKHKSLGAFALLCCGACFAWFTK